MNSHIKKSRYNPTRKWLIFWCLFIGIGAVGGAACMIIRPDGSLMNMQDMLPYFQQLPFADILFKDYLFSGVALLVVNGLSNLTAAYLLIRNRKTGVILGGLFGVTLMLWICIQFYMFPFNFMSTAYFVFGLIQAVTGYMAWVFLKQEAFVIKENNNSAIGSNQKELVVYFSRMGYTKKVAMEAAEKLGADLYEVHATEHTEDTSGFWWCGRYGMHRWAMPIEEISVDLSKYKHVTICSPIWVFSICGPIRSFCQKAAGVIKNADLILVHHNGGKYKKAAEEVEMILGIKLNSTHDIKCREGAFTIQ
ncbi:MAG: hypothetical protein Q4B85_07790 [Lachnospiraceae bacterium]|nr:hypothetical protein [Lachnospiraceae bacterium]